MLTLPKTEDLIAQLKARSVELPPGPVFVDGYGDSAELSEELLALIRSGRKRAGTGLLWAYQHDGQHIAQTGDIEIVVDHLNAPAMVTRVVSSEVTEFNLVTAQYAAMEGEGDGSLAYWRKAHWNFFGRECKRIGRETDESMPVICTVFEVLQLLLPPSEVHASCRTLRAIAALPRTFTIATTRHMLAIEPLPLVAGIAVLRRLEANDLAAFQAYRSDPKVGRFQGWSVMSDKEATAFLSEMHTCQLLRPGTWLQLGIAEPRSMLLLGDIGLRLADSQDEAEIGFTLAPQAQGRGIATAAVSAAIEFVFRHTSAKRVLGITDARNIASIRLLTGVGMQKIGSTPAVFRGESCIEDSYARYRDSGSQPS
jgi:uncharacterized protein YhfF/RimJ/RimL family protein N-acetyltransferase